MDGGALELQKQIMYWEAEYQSCLREHNTKVRLVFNNLKITLEIRNNLNRKYMANYGSNYAIS